MDSSRQELIEFILKNCSPQERQYLLSRLLHKKTDLTKDIPIRICTIDGTSVQFDYNHNGTILDVINQYKKLTSNNKLNNINLFSSNKGEDKIPDNTKINILPRNSDGTLVLFAIETTMRDAILINNTIEVLDSDGFCPYNCKESYESCDFKFTKIKVPSEIKQIDYRENPDLFKKQQTLLKKLNLESAIVIKLDEYNPSHFEDDEKNIQILILI